MAKANILTSRAKHSRYYALKTIAKAHLDKKRCFVVVPEQYTLQVEQDILVKLKIPGFIDIQVLSPSRLYHRIFEKGGQDGRTPIDSTGRHIAIRQALTKTQKSLNYYGKVSDWLGFGEKILNEIMAWKKENKDIDYINTFIENKESSEALISKMSDISIVWSEYEQILENQFLDDDGLVKDAINRIPDITLFDDSIIVVCDFDILSFELQQTLAALCNTCEKLYVFLTCDKLSKADGNMFSPIWKNIGKFTNLLKEKEISYLIKSLPFLENLYPSKEILHLSNNLFAYPANVYNKKIEDINYNMASNMFEELEHVANKLIEYKNKDIPLEHMAVLVGNLSEYASILYGVFSSYQIPFYIDSPMQATHHGLVRYIIHSIRAATKGYRTEDVLEFIKSGFANIDIEEAFELENYVLAYGINGTQWKKDFYKGRDWQVSKFEPMRKKIIDPLVKFYKNLVAAKDSYSSLMAFMGLLEDIEAYDKLLKNEERLLELGLEDALTKNRQVWELILKICDQMFDLSSGKRIPAAHFASWLEAALISSKIRGLPPTDDILYCGQLGHILPKNIKILFILGLHDNIISSDIPSLLTDEEKYEIEKKEVFSSLLNRQDLLNISQMEIWHSFSLPSDKIHLSFSQVSMSGEVLRPLIQLERLKEKIFPNLIVAGGLTRKTVSPPLSPLPALASLGGLLRKAFLDKRAANLSQAIDMIKIQDSRWQNAFLELFRNPDYQPKLSMMLETLFDFENIPSLPINVAQKLFGKQAFSVSRLETYGSCPYKHFVRYGLYPIERKVWEVTKAEIGIYYHEAFKNLTKIISEHDYWPNVKKPELKQMMDKALEPIVSSWADTPLADNPRMVAQGKRYINTMTQAAWIFTLQAQDSLFSPKYSEVSFGYYNSLLNPIFLKLKSGEKVMVRGVIDRIDLFKDNDRSYVRVIDLKSSRNTLSPEGLRWGLQLQLMLYLHVALELSSDSVPAGAFYFTVDNPYIESDRDIVEYVEEKLAGELKLKGIMLAETEVIKAMDSSPDSRHIGKVFNKDKSIGKRAMALNIEDMKNVISHSLDMANGFVEEIFKGKIDIAPKKIGQIESVCSYCDYKGICGIYEQNSNKYTKKIPKIELGDFKKWISMKDS